VELSRTFLKSRADIDLGEPLPDSFKQGLVKTRWPGRCQTVQDPAYPRTTWFLDGAHTHESLEYSVKWFAAPDTGLREKNNRRILIFNCTSGRSGGSFLGGMLGNIAEQLELYKSEETSGAFFDTVIFCTNVTYADGHFKGDLTSRSIETTETSLVKVQSELAAAWLSLIPEFPTNNVHVLPSIEHAIRVVREAQSEANEGVDVLVAGSLHLVGGVIEVAGLSRVAL